MASPTMSLSKLWDLVKDSEACCAAVHGVASDWTRLNIQKTKIMASGPITSWQIDGETVETVSDFIFWAPKSLQMVTAAMTLKDTTPWKESYDQPR